MQAGILLGSFGLPQTIVVHRPLRSIAPHPIDTHIPLLPSTLFSLFFNVNLSIVRASLLVFLCLGI